MSYLNKIIEKEDTVKLNVEFKSSDSLLSEIEFEKSMKKLREEIGKRFEEYRKTLSYMAADGPIEILCLPKVIENSLRDYGLLRVYDLLNVDFTKVKGLGVSRINQITSCLDKFFSM
jgi:hypothetical protein